MDLKQDGSLVLGGPAPDDRANAEVRQRGTRVGLGLREQLKHTGDVRVRDKEPGWHPRSD